MSRTNRPKKEKDIVCKEPGCGCLLEMEDSITEGYCFKHRKPRI